MSEWQPIETAPIKPFNKDEWFTAHSPHLLLWAGRLVTIGFYGFTKQGKGRWRNWNGIVEPTHWMPLPDWPKE